MMKRILLALALFACALIPARAAPTVTIVSCDGVTDVTSTLNTALSAAVSAGGGIVRIHGACPISNTVVIPGNVTFTGDGKNNSWLIASTCNFGAVFYNPAGVTWTQGLNLTRVNNATVEIANFSIQYPSCADTTKYAIHAVAQNSLGMTQISIHDLGIYGAPRGMLISDAIGGNIYNNTLMNFATVGIHIVYPNLPDSGGLNIHHNAMVNYGDGCAGSGYGMLLEGAPGLKISENGFACLYRAIFASLSGTSTQLSITNNTADTITDSAIFIQRANTNVTFRFVTVTGNVFLSPTALYIAPDTIWLSDVIFANNIVSGFANNNASAAYVDGVDGLTMAHNAMRSYSASPVAFNFGSHISGGVVGPNTLRGSFSTGSFPSSIVVLNPT